MSWLDVDWAVIRKCSEGFGLELMWVGNGGGWRLRCRDLVWRVVRGVVYRSADRNMRVVG